MFTINNISQDTNFTESIFNLEEECFPGDFWSFEIIKQNIISRNVIYIACFFEDVIVGYVCARYLFDEAELDRIAVGKNYRRKGIAKALIKSLTETLKSYDVTRLMLEVRAHNENAISVYSDYGFTVDTIRKNYYHNPSDDALLMSLAI